MTIKLRHVSNFLRVVKLHENENKSSEKEVKKTFDLQPVIENVYQNYNKFKKFCLDVEILKLKNDNFEFTKLGENILKNYEGNYLNKKQEELFIEQCFLNGNLSKKVLDVINIPEKEISIENILKKNTLNHKKEIKNLEILFRKIENDN